MTEQKGLFYIAQACLMGEDSNISNIHYENLPLQYTEIFFLFYFFFSVKIVIVLLLLLKTTALQWRF